jgi:hypothetical protein
MRVRVLNGTSGIGETGLRTRWLEAQGYKVIRFGNDDVIENIEGVGLRIIEEAQKRKSSLLHPLSRPDIGYTFDRAHRLHFLSFLVTGSTLTIRSLSIPSRWKLKRTSHSSSLICIRPIGSLARACEM